MASLAKKQPRTLSELIDQLERIREELLEIQQALEKKEIPDKPTGRTKTKSN
jgi:hypothetical protein